MYAAYGTVMLLYALPPDLVTEITLVRMTAALSAIFGRTAGVVPIINKYEN